MIDYDTLSKFSRKLPERLFTSPFFCCLPDVYTLTSLMFPKLLSSPKSGTLAPKDLSLVEELLEELGTRLNISSNCLPSLRITNEVEPIAYIIGFSHSIGGPTLTISSHCFPLMGQTDEENEWLSYLKQLPNDPLVLAKYLEDTGPEERKKIHAYTQKYFDRISKEELLAILGHELTHTKACHLLKIQAYVQTALLTLETVSSFFLNEGQKIVSLCLLPPSMLLSFAVQRENENEANAVGTAISKEGMYISHKKAILRHFSMSKEKDYVKETKERLASLDLFYNYPNSAKRLQQASSIEETTSPCIPMTSFGYAVATLGLACSIARVARHFIPLYTKK